MATDFAVADEEDAMVDFAVAVAAMQKLLRKNTCFICTKHAIREDGNRYRLILKQLSQLLIVSSVMLNVANW